MTKEIELKDLKVGDKVLLVYDYYGDCSYKIRNIDKITHKRIKVVNTYYDKKTGEQIGAAILGRYGRLHCREIWVLTANNKIIYENYLSEIRLKNMKSYIVNYAHLVNDIEILKPLYLKIKEIKDKNK